MYLFQGQFGVCEDILPNEDVSFISFLLYYVNTELLLVAFLVTRMCHLAVGDLGVQFYMY